MILATVVLVTLHGVNGHEIFVNPREVTSMHAAIPGKPNKTFTEGVRCMISTTDGKFVTVIETCEAVRQLFQNSKREP